MEYVKLNQKNTVQLFAQLFSVVSSKAKRGNKMLKHKLRIKIAQEVQRVRTTYTTQAEIITYSIKVFTFVYEGQVDMLL